MDFLEELAHSWGKSPEQKKREKEYNAEYYKKNKERWKDAKTGNVIPKNLKYLEEYIKDAPKTGSYAYLPKGVYPKTKEEEYEWTDAGFSYDENKGVWKWTPTTEKRRNVVSGRLAEAYAENEKLKNATALRNRMSFESSQSHAVDEKARLEKAKKRAAAYERGQNEKARLNEAKKQYDKREWTQTVKRRSEEYIRKKPYLDSLAASKAEQNVSAAKKARKFIDGYVEYTASSMKANSKKIKPAVSQGVQFIKDFFGWG